MLRREEQGELAAKFVQLHAAQDQQLMLAEAAYTEGDLEMLDRYMEILDGGEPRIEWEKEAVLGVVVASSGYPGDYQPGSLLPDLKAISDDLYLFHAGTARNQDGALVTAGGRVLLAAARADTLESAQKHVYSELEKIKGASTFFRNDIGNRAIGKVLP